MPALLGADSPLGWERGGRAANRDDREGRVGHWPRRPSAAIAFAGTGILLTWVYALRLTATIDAVLIVGVSAAAAIALALGACRRDPGTGCRGH